ncbi:hypothetical protein U1769_24305 [Sphingomonas sp. ZT3P38]|uniref:hypothetical protein n=1 Tax=Parasphingomonas zepuensis TaxID=3096161 RepID=UPI002FCBF3BC
MDTFATTLIATLGGSTAVSRMIEAPVSTIHSWKTNGIPTSRLAHLRLVARHEGIAVNWETGGPADHVDTDTIAVQHASPGNGDEISRQVPA